MANRPMPVAFQASLVNLIVKRSPRDNRHMRQYRTLARTAISVGGFLFALATQSQVGGQEYPLTSSKAIQSGPAAAKPATRSRKMSKTISRKPDEQNRLRIFIHSALLASFGCDRALPAAPHDMSPDLENSAVITDGRGYLPQTHRLHRAKDQS